MVLAQRVFAKEKLPHDTIRVTSPDNPEYVQTANEVMPLIIHEFASQDLYSVTLSAEKLGRRTTEDNRKEFVDNVDRLHSTFDELTNLVENPYASQPMKLSFLHSKMKGAIPAKDDGPVILFGSLPVLWGNSRMDATKGKRRILWRS